MGKEANEITIHVTAEDRQRIDALAEALSLSPDEVVREALTLLAERVRRKEDQAEMRAAAEAIAADPRERAEAKQIMKEMRDLL